MLSRQLRNITSIFKYLLIDLVTYH